MTYLHNYFIILCLTLFFWLIPSSAQAFSARVLWVTDGDTITVLKEDWSLDKIRIYGLDCPEKNQPYGLRAYMYSFYHLILREVQIEPVERDRYDRLVARIRLNKKNYNASLIQAGYAWVYDRYCQAEVCARYRRLEKEARENGRGLWKDEKSIPPWLWRRGKRPESNWRFW
jgi:endonuclease YncB( thermonuclease family)